MTTSARAAVGAPSPSADPQDPSADPQDPSAAVGAPSPSASGRAAAAERGRTVITRQAVERITRHLVDQCPDVEGGSRRWLGVAVGDGAAADAWLHGTTAVSLAVRCAVPYPRPVRASAEALRQLLIARVAELTGMRVQRVDITVTGLPAGAGGRRVQ
jgi:uncharacterized alkaline shock family protein YloU